MMGIQQAFPPVFFWVVDDSINLFHGGKSFHIMPYGAELLALPVTAYPTPAGRCCVFFTNSQSECIKY